jgi:23S rRNA pseudouridine2605 synthase
MGDAERLQKFLARAGVASRRKSEDLIRSGRVTVNGTIASIGQKVIHSQDQIRVDGELVTDPEQLVYIMINKPRGVLSSLRRQGNHRTVIDLVNVNTRVYPVGRLDLDSEGLILLTNDGELTYKLSHPRFGHEKGYKVLLNRTPDEHQLTAWRKGVVLEDGKKTAPAQVYLESNKGNQAWIRVIMKQGMKRQIRRTAEVLGLHVVRLIRVRLSRLKLRGLRSGEWRFLSENEVRALQGTGK